MTYEATCIEAIRVIARAGYSITYFISMFTKSFLIATALVSVAGHIRADLAVDRSGRSSSVVPGTHVYAGISSSINLASVVSVLDFGAKGDGTSDNTAAFQNALNSLQPLGGVVFVPAGNYSFSGSLNIPTATSLVGTYQSVPVRASHALVSCRCLVKLR
jgi:hypothetical protein